MFGKETIKRFIIIPSKKIFYFDSSYWWVSSYSNLAKVFDLICSCKTIWNLNGKKLIVVKYHELAIFQRSDLRLPYGGVVGRQSYPFTSSTGALLRPMLSPSVNIKFSKLETLQRMLLYSGILLMWYVYLITRFLWFNTKRIIDILIVFY